MPNKIIWLTIGKIVAAQGLKGEVRVNPSSDFPERFISPGERWLQEKKEEPEKVKLTSGRQLPGQEIYIVSFLGIASRTQAGLLVGIKLLVKSSHRPTLKRGEFHLLDLIDLSVRLLKSNKEIGKVTDLIHAGNDLLEVELSTGQKILIPFVKEIVPEVNIKKKWILITPPKGLLDLE